MTSPRGFLDIKYKSPNYRNIQKRIQDFKEVEIPLTLQEIQEQAGRCMDCGIPFCHGCGCTLSNQIPEWNELIYEGHWEEAVKLLLSTNNFPEFTGRVCPALCEASCTVGMHCEAVSIRQIEKVLIEYAFNNRLIKPNPPTKRTDKKIAVIGSGPAGLTVADTLNKKGHYVTVFEKDYHLGGLLRYGIPDFKLDKSIVSRRISFMNAEGVNFETNIKVGEDISASYLQKKYDAICLTCGARKPRDIDIKGRNLKNIVFAMDFLCQQNKRLNSENIQEEEILATNKNVVVIGGGDTGSDCVGTAIRQNAKSVTQIEIMPQPPLERSEATPWPLWPYKLKTSTSHEEGCKRLWNIKTKQFEGENGEVKNIKAVKVNWKFSEQGYPITFEEVSNSEFTYTADLVIIAMGFVGVKDLSLFSQFNLKYDKKGNISVDSYGKTNISNVFAGGDAAKGASLVVNAIDSGIVLAKNIDEVLKDNKQIHSS